MTIEEPEPIQVALLPGQIEALEAEVEDHPEAEDKHELLQLLISDYTGTLESVTTPHHVDVARIRRHLERQEELLEELEGMIDDGDGDLNELVRLLVEVREEQEYLRGELETTVIY